MNPKHDDVLRIDGSQGEGGGQILRTALSLAVLEQRPIMIERIRAGRPKPGLMRQHLACVKAAADVSAAEVEGAEPGSTRLWFKPHTMIGGNFHFAIGSAGSAMLVLQTVLPILLRVGTLSRVCIEGGTHNPLAPSATFVQQAFLPMLRQLGADVRLEVERVGLFPAGGGRVVAEIRPAVLNQAEWLSRGDFLGIGVEAVVAGVPRHVAERELAVVRNHFGDRVQESRVIESKHTTGPGNVLSVWAKFQHVSEVVTAFGARGLSAEAVAAQACQAIDCHMQADSQASIGEHLSDQLLLPLWLAGGGRFRCAVPSPHLLSNIAVINQFRGPRISVSGDGAGHCVQIG